MGNFHKLVDKNYYAFSTLAFLISIIILVTNFLKNDILNSSELYETSGLVEKYNYKPSNNQKYTYLIKLSEFKSDFMIPANYLSIFRKSDFEKYINSDKKIKVLINKNDIKNLNKNLKILLHGIKNNNQIFLNENNSLEINKKLKEKNLLISLCFVICGILYFIIRKYFWTPKKHYS